MFDKITAWLYNRSSVYRKIDYAIFENRRHKRLLKKNAALREAQRKLYYQQTFTNQDVTLW